MLATRALTPLHMRNAGRAERGYRTGLGGNFVKPSKQITNEGGRGMYIGGGLLAIILIIIILILIF
jgi:hypothetical protein